MINMTREFIMTSIFDKQWKEMGLYDKQLAQLQQIILDNPQIGSVIKGTGRLRKMRFAIDGKGKSGSIRVTYVDFAAYGIVYLIYTYSKNKKENLTKAECHMYKKMIDAIDRAFERRYEHGGP